ncbi:DUF29 domain-containing protein [Beijerinckia sp. L45]|uniref:DUF29 domain-containing protein n=1 Tax=Beijerinckia sp. L45 TaxID=1641855 RepID=UPI00131CE5C2|nr:DUF29 domain-containing protein [Beijerinckia sp. L45]
MLNAITQGHGARRSKSTKLGEIVMTRDEWPDSDAGLYRNDFYSWTQREAARLRALPPDVFDRVQLDVANLAEEIADLGKRDLREVMSYLGLVIQHLIKLQAAPDARDAAHWHAEAVNFQSAARRAFSPGMRQLIDVAEIWTDGGRAARRFLRDHGAHDRSLNSCPFTLDDLLAADFDVDAAVAQIGAR